MAFSIVPTTVGLAKLAAATAGTPLALTQMVLGDANGVPYEPTGGESALVNQVYLGGLNALMPDPTDATRTLAELVVPFDAGPFIVREIGLLDAAGDLIFIGNYPLSEKTVAGSGAARELIVRAVLPVSPTSDIVLLIDPTILLATQDWVRRLVGGPARRFFFAQL
ncbi:MAG: phage tail protein [Xanthomonadaceae bacterium]|nr:phage tail protein [Xanthomonadaceae bacterium]